MDGEAEKVGEEIASEISDAIETANARADDRQELADAIIDGALETERGRRIEQVERDLGECLSNQAALSEAMTGMALQMEQLQGSLSTLLSLQPSMISQEATSQSAQEDGPRENPEAEATVVIAPEAEAVEIPPAAPEPPARKRKRWI